LRKARRIATEMQNVLIAKLNTPQCPVTILQCYIREAKIDLSTDKYIFRPLIYFKREHFAISVAIRLAFLNKNIYVSFMESNIIRFDITQLIIP
jgi:hypothetical protein